MLDVKMIGKNEATVRVGGDIDEFERDKTLIQELPSADREYDLEKKEWRIKNIRSHLSIAPFRRAIEDWDKQLRLF